MPGSPGAASDSLVARLQATIQDECGAGANVVAFRAMEDGHAGQTFGFDVEGGSVKSYVLKVAPQGVARRGNTDVYRQAPLLRALKRLGLPVPDVPFASAGEAPLGEPFIVMERLPGRVFVIWEPHALFSRAPADVRDLWLQAARLLARVHQVDWRTALADWEAPRSPRDELVVWPHVLRHAQDPAWLAAGTELGASLATRVPEAPTIGLVHGDFQPGNILYEEGRARGLIDWELASIGSQGLDLGWLLMMSDIEAWDPSFRPFASVTPEDLIGAYREAGGPAAHDLDWHHALALYRLGSIACLNIKLHRTGKRVDELWERFASSVPLLFQRGIELASRVARNAS